MPLASGRTDLRASGWGIDLASIRRIEDYIEDNKASRDKLAYGFDVLIRVLANITLQEARNRSQGPVAARHRSNPALAYKIPVQRITGAYYAGWTLRRVRNAHWMVYNDTFEAWLIETGMFLRMRRPILKMSVIAMLKFIQSTRTAEMFADHVLAPRRSANGRFRSFEARIRQFKIVNAPEGYKQMRGKHLNMAGPRGRLP